MHFVRFCFKITTKPSNIGIGQLGPGTQLKLQHADVSVYALLQCTPTYFREKVVLHVC